MPKAEFDYDASDMDEQVSVQPIPEQATSLASSRSMMTTSRKVLLDLEYFIEEAKNKENAKIN